MRIEQKSIILNTEEDFEFCKLVSHIVKIKHGEIVLKVRYSKPYRILKEQTDILLTRNALKDSKDYGE